MTFVAHPFEQVTDDLLTGLTGGVAREEHRFTGPEDNYSLAAPDPVEATLRVVGQVGESFTTFERGLDFDYVAADAAIRWRSDEGARRPDPDSFFYVSYFRREADRRLTDRNPGSVTRTLAEAFAREYAVLHKQMEGIYRCAFIDLASGASLEHVAALLGLERRDARFATGEAMFRRGTPAPGDINILSGALVSTELGQNFETTDRRTLRRGQLAVVAPIRARTEGPDGQVAAGEIRIIDRPIFGIDSVSNEAGTFFATERETDEQLRRRVRSTLERAGKSTLNAIKFALIEEVPGVDHTNVEVRNTDTPGFVNVRLGLRSGSEVPRDILDRTEEAIEKSRPAGVRVVHNLRLADGPGQPSATGNGAMSVSGAAAPGEAGGRTVAGADVHRFDQADLDQLSDESLLQLRVDVELRLTDPAMSAADREAVVSEVRDRVIRHVDTLPMGNNLVHSKLLGRIVEPEAVADGRLTIGPKVGGWVGTPFRGGTLAALGRKVTIEYPPDVQVTLMAEPVRIDLRVLVESGPRAGDGEVAAAPGITGAHRASVRDAVAALLQEISDEVTREEVEAAIGAALTEARPRLQLIENDPVQLNAEYADTGRLLAATDAVAFEPHHLPILGELDILMPGPGDV